MKTKILLTSFLLLFIVTTLKAQTKSASIDGQSDSVAIFKINPVGQDFYYQKLKFKRQFKFEFSHVNTFIVDGYTTSNPVNFEFAAPSIFANVTVPTPPAGANTAPVGAMPAVAAMVLPNAFGTEKMYFKKNANKQDDKFVAKNEEIKALKAQLAARNKELSDEFIKSYYAFIATCQKLKRGVIAEDTLYKMMPDIIIRDVDALKKNTTFYMTSVYGVQEGELEAALNKLLADFNTQYLDLKSAYQALNGTDISAEEELTGALKNKAGSVAINVTKATATINSDPKFLDEYTAATKIFTDLNTGDNQRNLFNKAIKGIILYRRIQAANFITQSQSDQLLSDEMLTTPQLKNNKKVILQTFNPVLITATGGIKVDFTTGYLLTFKADDNYTEGVVGGAKGVIRQETNKLTNAIGALAHVYCRTAYGVTPALSGGFSLTNNGNIGFYLGGSGLFLEKNRLALTAGISCIKVNVLNNGNLTDNKFNSDNTIINYDSLYKTGFFVGITYNIFTNNSNKSTSK